MEHIGHFPGSLCCIAFDGMGQGIHTCRSGKSLRHGGHHIRVNDRNDRHVMRVNAYKFTFSLDIGDNIVDRNLGSSTGCCRNGDDRNTRFFRRCNTLKTSYILKFRVCDDDADRFGGIHGGAAADGDQVVSAGCLKGFNTVLDILDRRVCFNIGVELVVKTVCGQNVGYFGGNLEFYEIRVGTYERLFKAVGFCLVRDLLNRACSVIRCLI